MKRINCAVWGLACGLAGWATGASSALADPYKGAAEVLRQVASASEQPAGAPASPAEKWYGEWKALPEKLGGLSPEKAAGQWLDLVERYGNLSGQELAALPEAERRELLYNGLRNPLITVLPGPAAWPELVRMIDARAARTAPRAAMFEAALRLLAHTLVHDPAGQREAMGEMANIKGQPGRLAGSMGLASLEEALSEGSEDPVAVKAGFQARMDAQKKRFEQMRGTESEIYLSLQDFEAPDLVTILGSEKEAEPLLKEAILLPAQLTVAGTETRRLAMKLALEQVANLKQPCWGLACSLDGAPLFEALQKRFPEVAPDGPDARARSPKFAEARGYYFLHLIVAGQAAKAVEMADALSGHPEESLPSLPLEALDDAGYTSQVCDFLHDLLAKHPEDPFWSEYIRLAAKAGKTSEMLALIRTAASAPQAPDKDGQRQAGGARESFYLALLSADQIDEGITELRKIIASSEAVERSRDAGGGSSNALGKEIALARLGQLLKRQDLLDEGISAAKKHLGSDTPQTDSGSELSSLAELLVQIGRGPEAEEILAHALSHFQPAAGVRPDARQDSLAALVRVYYLAERPDDVIGVLQRFAGWGVADLSDLLAKETEGYSLAEFSTHAAADTYPVAYMAAWALAQRGQKDQALRIANAVLDQNGGCDPAFELMTKLSGQQALGRLDELARRDRFEERPLIWKAQLQREAGQLDEAEKTIRAAIDIDPSDGEQGPGRRMRAYAVLADVLERKVDKEHAETYRGAVAAIRISEHADRFYEAGLLTRAVKMYEEALTHFADAYCIQSRLALRLSELGDSTGAEEHYRRAYELMPVSFGRVESHCFGCERAFEGHRAQSIAEKVFTQLAAKMPGKPQVHYLLGYLRMEEGRYREALPEYQEAVKLDPDYLNAWKKIGELNGQMHLPVKLRDEVALNQVRLDPLQRHGSPDASGVTDLAGLWKAVAAGSDLQPPAPGPLFPLTASATELKNAKPDPNGGMMAPFMDTQAFGGRALKPVDSIARNRFIEVAGSILVTLAEWPSE